MKRGKLPAEDVKRILELRETKATYQIIAVTVGCSIGTVRNVCKGITHGKRPDLVPATV